MLWALLMRRDPHTQPQHQKPPEPGHSSRALHSTEIGVDPGPHTCSGACEGQKGTEWADMGRPHRRAALT